MRPIFLAMAAILAVRAVLAYFVPSPYIFPDELVYTKIARSLFESGQSSMRGHPLNFPTLLYPLMLAPVEGLADPQQAFRLIQALNIVLMTSAALPVYLLARLFVMARPALAVAVLSQVLPSTLYANLAMTENVFFPLLMWAAYFAVRACSEPGARWKVGLGAALALGFFAKPHGMVALPLVLAILVAWHALQRGAEGGAEGKPLGPDPARPDVRVVVRRIGAFWPTYLLLGGAVALHIIRSVAASGGHLDSSAVFGSYAAGLQAVHPFNLFWFGWAALGTTLAVGMSIGFLPLVLFEQFCEDAFEERKQADSALIVFTLTLGALLLGITANHTVTMDDGVRIHERYVFHIAPLIMVGAVAVATRSRPTSWQVGLTLVLAATTAAYYLAVANSPVTVDTLTFATILPLGKAIGTKAAVWASAIVAPLLVGAVAALWWRGRAMPAVAVLAAYMVGIFGLAYVAQRDCSVSWGTRDRYVPFIAQHVAAAPSSPIAFIRHDGHFWDYMMVEFHLRRQTRLYQLTERPTGFNEEPADLRSDGELERLRGLPDGAFVVSTKEVPLALPVLGRFEDLTIYRKEGPVRLSSRSQVRELLEKVAKDKKREPGRSAGK